MKIQSLERLSLLIRELQHEVRLFVLRGEQFTEAKVIRLFCTMFINTYAFAFND